MKRLGPVLLLTLMTSVIGFGQGPAGGGRGRVGPPPTPRAAAPFDLTGYWVSILTEDWRWRMFPNKGDYGGIPLNQAGRQAAAAWDPAKDQAGGDQCKGYGAPAIMHIPGRVHVTWQDDQTLKIETDAGKQSRVLRFAAPNSEGGDLQGASKAEWESNGPGLGFAIAGGGAPGGAWLKVTTTKLRPGYLRRNGVPYSANAKLTEYYDLIKETNGDTYLILTSTVEDPSYLSQPWITSVHFKKQTDARGWNPAACAVR